jgi:hypothetical protein
MLLFPVLRGEERRGEEEGRERERGREGAGEGSWNIALCWHSHSGLLHAKYAFYHELHPQPLLWHFYVNGSEKGEGTQKELWYQKFLGLTG